MSAEDKRPFYENEHFSLRLSLRTPDQLAAFYEARGFPDNAINIIRNTCFIGIGLRNKGKNIIWFNLDNWHFTNKDGKIKRILRRDWKETWNKQGLPKRFQSTFRWTLMPEQLDFQAYEGEGGNITLPKMDKPFDINATIYTGRKKENMFKIEFKNITCADDPK